MSNSICVHLKLNESSQRWKLFRIAQSWSLIKHRFEDVKLNEFLLQVHLNRTWLKIALSMAHLKLDAILHSMTHSMTSSTISWPISVETIPNCFANDSAVVKFRRPYNLFSFTSDGSSTPSLIDAMKAVRRRKHGKNRCFILSFSPGPLMHLRHWRKWENSLRASLSIELLKFHELIIHCVTFIPQATSPPVRMKIAFISGLRLPSMLFPTDCPEWAHKNERMRKERKKLGENSFATTFHLTSEIWSVSLVWLATLGNDLKAWQASSPLHVIALTKTPC